MTNPASKTTMSELTDLVDRLRQSVERKNAPRKAVKEVRIPRALLGEFYALVDEEDEAERLARDNVRYKGMLSVTHTRMYRWIQKNFPELIGYDIGVKMVSAFEAYIMQWTDTYVDPRAPTKPNARLLYNFSETEFEELEPFLEDEFQRRKGRYDLWKKIYQMVPAVRTYVDNDKPLRLSSPPLQLWYDEVSEDDTPATDKE
jgi:hypothetical protein